MNRSELRSKGSGLLGNTAVLSRSLPLGCAALRLAQPEISLQAVITELTTPRVPVGARAHSSGRGLTLSFYLVMAPQLASHLIPVYEMVHSCGGRWIFRLGDRPRLHRRYIW